MPEKDLHLFDQTRLQAHDRPGKPGDDGIGVCQPNRKTFRETPRAVQPSLTVIADTGASREARVRMARFDPSVSDGRIKTKRSSQDIARRADGD
jgi:hypothetical protein